MVGVGRGGELVASVVAWVVGRVAWYGLHCACGKHYFSSLQPPVGVLVEGLRVITMTVILCMLVS